MSNEKLVSMLNSSPALRNLNLICAIEDKQKTIRINDIEPYHLGGMAGDSYNGMFIVSMLELAIGLAGVETFMPSKSGVVEMSYKFYRVIPSTIEIYAKSEVLKKSRGICFCKAEILDFRGRAYACANGIVSKF